MSGFPVSASFDTPTMAAINGMVTAQNGINATLRNQDIALLEIATSLNVLAASASVAPYGPPLIGIQTSLASIAKMLATPPPPPPVSIRLALPEIVKKGKVMANFELANDEVATIPILVDDASGDPVAPPSGDTFSVVSSSASLGAAISADGKGVVLTPLVKVSPGLSITVSDSAGLSAFTLGVDIVSDTTPKAITLDVANATEVSQPVPTAPGP